MLDTVFGLDRQEVAALALALAILGFSVVAAILLMRTRTRAGENELRLRSEIQTLQAKSDRSDALLSFEPQVVNDALLAHQLVRSVAMRGTIHLVSATDAQPLSDQLSHLTLITCTGAWVNGSFNLRRVVYAIRASYPSGLGI